MITVTVLNAVEEFQRKQRLLEFGRRRLLLRPIRENPEEIIQVRGRAAGLKPASCKEFVSVVRNIIDSEL